MRTTIDLPEREHRLFLGLARERKTSLGKLLVELAQQGLRHEPMIAEAVRYEVDPDTGLGLFRSGRPVGPDDVRALLDE